MDDNVKNAAMPPTFMFFIYIPEQKKSRKRWAFRHIKIALGFCTRKEFRCVPITVQRVHGPGGEVLEIPG